MQSYLYTFIWKYGLQLGTAAATFSRKQKKEDLSKIKKTDLAVWLSGTALA